MTDRLLTTPEAAKIAIDGGLGRRESMCMFERALLLHALEASDGNQCEAAHRLGMHRNNFRLRLIALDIKVERPPGGVKRKPPARERRFKNRAETMAYIREALGKQ